MTTGKKQKARDDQEEEEEGAVRRISEATNSLSQLYTLAMGGQKLSLLPGE